MWKVKLLINIGFSCIRRLSAMRKWCVSLCVCWKIEPQLIPSSKAVWLEHIIQSQNSCSMQVNAAGAIIATTYSHGRCMTLCICFSLTLYIYVHPWIVVHQSAHWIHWIASCKVHFPFSGFCRVIPLLLVAPWKRMRAPKFSLAQNKDRAMYIFRIQHSTAFGERAKNCMFDK